MKTFITGLGLCLLLGSGIRAQQDDGKYKRHNQQEQHSNGQPDQNRQQPQPTQRSQQPSAHERAPQGQAPPQNQNQSRNQNRAVQPQNENRQERDRTRPSDQPRQADQSRENQDRNGLQQGHYNEKDNQNRHAQDRNSPQRDQKQRYSQPDQARQPDQNRSNQDRAGQSQQRGYAPQRGNERDVWQQARAQNWRSQHRSWQQRGGYRGYRVPADRFNVYFGRQHEFRISAFPLFVVGGYPRFQYNGYFVNFVDPIPEYWAGDWYETDEVYIDYSGDGYYLYDTRYPEDRVAVELSVQ